MSSSPPRTPDVTVVITSCNRYDLLERTLASFVKHNTDPGVARILVVEDGEGDPSAACKPFNAESLRCGARVGQIAAIDRAYATVRTPYIFHLEDDWEFYRSGFIERSRAILAADPSTIQVSLRAWDDNNGQPLTFAAEDRSFAVLARYYGGVWGGLSFNPGLRRLSDYQRIGPYSKLPLKTPGVHVRPSAGLQYEVEASMLYLKLGYRMVLLDEGGYVRHIGEDRHVPHPEDETIAQAAQIRGQVGRNDPCPCGSGKKFKHCHGQLVP